MDGSVSYLRELIGYCNLPFWRVDDWFWSNPAVGGKVTLALPLAWPKDCLYKDVPFKPGNPGGPPEVGVTDMG